MAKNYHHICGSSEDIVRCLNQITVALLTVEPYLWEILFLNFSKLWKETHKSVEFVDVTLLFIIFVSKNLIIIRYGVAVKFNWYRFTLCQRGGFNAQRLYKILESVNCYWIEKISKIRKFQYI